MINLKNYIFESIFDVEDNIDNVDESIKDQIRQFLKNNFKNASKCKISKKPNKDGKFEVLSTGDVVVKNKQINSLTNGSFIWTNIKGDFICSDCNLLKSLEGAPKEVGRDFSCGYCNLITSLEGAPKEVGGDFSCEYCTSLTTLEGAPNEVGGGFYCEYCNLITSLKGSSEKIGDSFYCNDCTSLTTLEGAPKEVNGDFSCVNCGKVFYKEDIKKVSNVRRMIYV